MSYRPQTICEVIALSPGHEGARLAIGVTAEMQMWRPKPPELQLLHDAADLGYIRFRCATDDIITDAKVFHFTLTARGAALYATFP